MIKKRAGLLLINLMIIVLLCSCYANGNITSRSDLKKLAIVSPPNYDGALVQVREGIEIHRGKVTYNESLKKLTEYLGLVIDKRYEDAYKLVEYEAKTHKEGHGTYTDFLLLSDENRRRKGFAVIGEKFYNKYPIYGRTYEYAVEYTVEAIATNYYDDVTYSETQTYLLVSSLGGWNVYVTEMENLDGLFTDEYLRLAIQYYQGAGKEKDLTKAEGYLSDARVHDKSRPQIFLMEAMIHIEKGELEFAEMAMEECFKRSMDDKTASQAHYVSGIIQELKNQKEAATTSYEKALKLDPENKDAKELLEKLKKNQ